MCVTDPLFKVVALQIELAECLYFFFILYVVVELYMVGIFFSDNWNNLSENLSGNWVSDTFYILKKG